ncbi:MAG TPA: hypothetical protein VF911_18815 [Thermoanaerobaculia bacterium]
MSGPVVYRDIHAQARWFVTTDDRLLRKAREHREQMQIDVLRPDELPVYPKVEDQ